MDRRILSGKLEVKMSGETCIDGIRVETFIKQHVGKPVTIILGDEETEEGSE